MDLHMPVKGIAVIAVIVTLIPACATHLGRGVTVPASATVPPRDAAPAALLRYAQTVAHLSPEALTTELLRAEQRFHDTPDAGNRIRLAMVLSVPGSGAGNQRQAVDLLAVPGLDPELQPLAAMLSDFLVRIARLRGQLQTSEEESARLHRQLESLTTIERHIQKRGLPEDLHGR